MLAHLWEPKHSFRFLFCICEKQHSSMHAYMHSVDPAKMLAGHGSKKLDLYC